MSLSLDIASAVRSHQRVLDAESHAVAMAALETGRPMWPRSEFEPGHFTASGFVASPDGRSMLLVHHGRLDRWLQPGGHFEWEDNTVEDASRREVGEETGVTALTRLGIGLVRVDAHSIPARTDEPAHIHIDLGLAFVAESDHIGPIEEVLDARWVPFDEFHRYDLDEAVMVGSAHIRELLGS